MPSDEAGDAPSGRVASDLTAPGVISAVLAAAGHGAVYGLVVWLAETARGTGNFDTVGPPMAAFAALTWLLVVGRRRPSVLRLAATGYAVIVPAAIAILLSFGLSLETSIRLGVLIFPLALLVTGTACAAVSILYGLALRALPRR